MNRLLLAIAIGGLCGCVAKNPVLKLDEWEKAYQPDKRSGVVFALPQTRLELSYALENKSFEKGKHTAVIDACQKGGFLELTPICKELRDAGLGKSQRLSDPKTRYDADRFCESDGSDNESRTLVSEGATLQSDFVPDDKEVYVVPLRRSYFQTFEVQLELNANGTIGKGSLSTENLGTKEFLEAAVKVAANFASGESAPSAPMWEPRSKPKPDSADVDAAKVALAELQELQRKRDEISARNDDDALASRAVQLTYLDAKIARVRSDFVGTVKATPAGQFRPQWIPSDSALDAPIGGKFEACATEKSEQPRQLHLMVSSDGAGLSPSASKGFSATNFNGARGWPYRVPAERDVVWKVCNATPPAPNAKLSCEAIDSKRLLLAQFGPTLRLPEATGGRKSVIAPEYYADGSLKKLAVTHVGESPVPLIAGAQGLLTPATKAAPPSETAELTSQAALISARQALCRLVLAVSATDARCLGPNPPTTLPPTP